MKAQLEKKEKNTATIKIEVTKEKFAEAIEKSYRKNVKKFFVPGFRKGKVPRKILEARYGEAIFYEDAVNLIIPEVYPKAVKETGIEPVDNPKFDILQLEKDKPFIFTAEVTVKPEVKLGEYKGIEAEKLEYEVTEKTVNDELEKIRQKNARLVSVENRAAQKGDIVIIDFEGFIDGQPFEGGKAENFPLELGSGSFIPGFEEQLEGVKIDDEKEIKVTFPEEYHLKEFAGKEAIFKVKVKEIKEKQLPELDDEFAKDVSEFETLQEFRKDLENKIKERLENLSKNMLQDTIVKKVTENAEVDIPEVMVENQINNMIRNFSLQLRYQGTNLETYLDSANMTQEDLKSKFRDDAYYDVKAALVLEAIAKQEKLEATQDEIDEELKEMAKVYNKSFEDYKKNISEEQLERIKDNIVNRKTLDFLVDNANIKVKSIKEGESNIKKEEETNTSEGEKQDGVSES
ncbi:MAG: trigger factor [Thermosediminibacterales bacterium]|nr:trigger factor [Thermosediminibacterales bacterium]MDK2835731.1 trigger factor [Thermosediminibacterales bacterium]